MSDENGLPRFGRPAEYAKAIVAAAAALSTHAMVAGSDGHFTVVEVIVGACAVVTSFFLVWCTGNADAPAENGQMAESEREGERTGR